MNYEEVSVNYFFKNQEIIGKKVTSVESSVKIAELREEISKKVPEMKWTAVYNEVLGTCSELLDIKLTGILEGAWMKYQQVEHYLEQGKSDPGVTFLVPLVNHTIVSEHQPKIEIRIDEFSMGKIDFEIHLELELSGVILKIKESRIDGVKAGSCKCKGSLSCEGIILFEAGSQTFDF